MSSIQQTTQVRVSGVAPTTTTQQLAQRLFLIPNLHSQLYTH